ncbi:unnamed protein product [Notodromas monacha]|uniref:Mediator of RNA polymerase II transcription subunit 1 n=1 Tax=Notodromas monacha TaxID=399045 RepID=A0A7R9BC64_9CRUS|nr:unnamed protein product [Notodromas monacha]CAG0912570.1 unnamed protein product [Notodromas monacha]
MTISGVGKPQEGMASSATPITAAPVGAVDEGAQSAAAPAWQLQLLMERLRTRSGQMKSWQENAKASKAVLMERRILPEASERAQMQRCLDALQKSIKVNSVAGMVQRLEALANQIGLKFSMGRSGPEGLDVFFSSDLFYVEILLVQNGEVGRVKIQHNSDPDTKTVPELVEVLKTGNFVEFAAHMEHLKALYHIHSDSKYRGLAWAVISSLEADLATLAKMQDAFIPDTFSLVHKTPVGILVPRRGGKPLELTFFISPYELLDERTGVPTSLTVDVVREKSIGKRGSVNLLPSSSMHKLQIMSLISISKYREGNSLPSFVDHCQTNSSLMPACFAFVLKVPIPLCAGVLKGIKKVTGLSSECLSPKTEVKLDEAMKSKKEEDSGDIDEELRRSAKPFLNLLVDSVAQGKLNLSSSGGERTPLFVTLPDQQHCYYLKGLVVADTNVPNLSNGSAADLRMFGGEDDVEMTTVYNGTLLGLMVSRLPFTHPTHLPQILLLLRQQLLLNTLLASCVRTNSRQDFESSTVFEIEIPSDSWQCVWVRFEHPLNLSMVTAEFDLTDISHLKCRLFYDETIVTPEEQILCSEEYASKVIQKTFSIPVTMRAILRKLYAGRKKPAEDQAKPAMGTLAGPQQPNLHGPKKTGSDITSDIQPKLSITKNESGSVGSAVHGSNAGPSPVFVGPQGLKSPVIRVPKIPGPPLPPVLKPGSSATNTVSAILQSGGHVTVKPGSLNARKGDGAFHPPSVTSASSLHQKLHGPLMHFLGPAASGTAASSLSGQVSRRGRKRKITAPPTPSAPMPRLPGRSPKRFALDDGFGDDFDGSVSAPASVDGSSPSSDDGKGVRSNVLAEHLKIFQGPVKSEVTFRPLSNPDPDRIDDDDELDEEEESIAAISAALNRGALGKPTPVVSKKPKPGASFSTLQRSLSSNADTSSMLLHLSEKTALSITPVSSSSVGLMPPTVTTAPSATSTSVSPAACDSGNPLARFGLERRPGIEIIPISSSSAVAQAQNPENADIHKEEKKVKLRDVRKESVIGSTALQPTTMSAEKKSENRKKRKREKEAELGQFMAGLPTAKLSKYGGMGPPFSGTAKPMNIQAAVAMAAAVSASGVNKQELPAPVTRSPITLNIKQGTSSFKRSTSDTSIKVTGKVSNTNSGSSSPTFVKAASISPKFGSSGGPPGKHFLPPATGSSPNRTGSPKPPSSPKQNSSSSGTATVGGPPGGLGGPPGLNPLAFTLGVGGVVGGPQSMSSYKIPKLKDRTKAGVPSASAATTTVTTTTSASAVFTSTAASNPATSSAGAVGVTAAASSTTVTPAMMSNSSETVSGNSPGSVAPGASPPLSSSGVSGAIGGGKNAAMKNRKSSLSAVIDKLRSSAEGSDGIGIGSTTPSSSSGSDDGMRDPSKPSDSAASGDEATNEKSLSSPASPSLLSEAEFIVKPSSQGIKLTVTKTRLSESPTSLKIPREVASPTPPPPPLAEDMLMERPLAEAKDGERSPRTAFSPGAISPVVALSPAPSSSQPKLLRQASFDDCKSVGIDEVMESKSVDKPEIEIKGSVSAGPSVVMSDESPMAMQDSPASSNALILPDDKPENDPMVENLVQVVEEDSVKGKSKEMIGEKVEEDVAEVVHSSMSGNLLMEIDPLETAVVIVEPT